MSDMQVRVEREAMEFDVVMVGAGPCGPRQRDPPEAEQPSRINVVVLEKGSEVGAHILSGAVIDPVAQQTNPGLAEQRLTDQDPGEPGQLLLPGPAGALRNPISDAPLMTIMATNRQPRQRLPLAGEQAASSASRSPGFAASEVLYDENGAVSASRRATWRRQDGEHKNTYTPGMELHGKYAVFAEGARGYLVSGSSSSIR